MRLFDNLLSKCGLIRQSKAEELAQKAIREKIDENGCPRPGEEINLLVRNGRKFGFKVVYFLDSDPKENIKGLVESIIPYGSSRDKDNTGKWSFITSNSFQIQTWESKNKERLACS